jgi:hypothetical protein
MTLCISHKFQFNEAIPFAVCYADSRITVIGASSEQTSVGRFLQSNKEIKHQTDSGIKIQIVSAIVVDGDEIDYRDFAFSIAGAVSLGLQSLIYLDSVFKTFYENYTFEEYIERIKITLYQFWKDAWDQEIEYLMTATDDSGKIRIIHIRGTETNLVFEEVSEEDELLFAVIGDHAEEARQKIRQETNSLMCAGMEMHLALEAACVRMMRRAIEDQNQIFIGGNIQACQLMDKRVTYLPLDDGCNLLFRGVKYSRERHDYPRNLNTLDRPRFPVLDINQDKYNPQKSIQEIMEQIKVYQS